MEPEHLFDESELEALQSSPDAMEIENSGHAVAASAAAVAAVASHVAGAHEDPVPCGAPPQHESSQAPQVAGELGSKLRVQLAAGGMGMLSSIHRRTEGKWAWQLAVPGQASRPSAAARACPASGLAAWLDAHGSKLTEDELSRIRGMIAGAFRHERLSEMRSSGADEAPQPPGPRQGSASELLSPTLPPPPPPPGPILCCPLCPAYRSRSTARGLVRHLTSQHIGQSLGAEGAKVLTGLGRGLCPHCCGLRSVWSRECPHCAAADPARPARADDKVSLPSHAAKRAPAGAGIAAPKGSQPPLLPRDWDARIDALPSNTLVHIPAQFRERLAIATAEGLEDLLCGGRLERGRAKLLLSPPQRGIHRNTELAERFR